MMQHGAYLEKPEMSCTDSAAQIQEIMFGGGVMSFCSSVVILV